MSRNRNCHEHRCDERLASAQAQNAAMRNELQELFIAANQIASRINLAGDNDALRAELVRVSRELQDLATSVRAHVGEVRWQRPPGGEP